MDNYMMYSGTDGVYTHTAKYERDPADPACGAGVAVSISADMTLQQVCALSKGRAAIAHRFQSV
jgi:NEDD8-activating enzyme E1